MENMLWRIWNKNYIFQKPLQSVTGFVKKYIELIKNKYFERKSLDKI